MEHLLSLFVRSIFVDNMIFAFFLGMCSYLAVSKNVKTAVGLGIAVTFVLVVTLPVNYLLQTKVLGPNAIIEDFEQVLSDILSVEEAGYEKGCETFSPRLAERVKIGVQIAKEYADDADTFSKKIYDVIGSGVGIIESVPAAISIAYYTQDPNECCLMCANLGGDTDTIGAMATAICGAFTGYSKINPEYTELLRVQNSETDFDEYINILKKGRELAGCGR